MGGLCYRVLRNVVHSHIARGPSQVLRFSPHSLGRGSTTVKLDSKRQENVIHTDKKKKSIAPEPKMFKIL